MRKFTSCLGKCIPNKVRVVSFVQKRWNKRVGHKLFMSRRAVPAFPHLFFHISNAVLFRPHIRRR